MSGMKKHLEELKAYKQLLEDNSHEESMASYINPDRDLITGVIPKQIMTNEAVNMFGHYFDTEEEKPKGIEYKVGDKVLIDHNSGNVRGEVVEVLKNMEGSTILSYHIQLNNGSRLNYVPTANILGHISSSSPEEVETEVECRCSSVVLACSGHETDCQWLINKHHAKLGE
jgi:hypothetical protein